MIIPKDGFCAQDIVFVSFPRSLFLFKQGISAEALMFDGLSINTHREAFNTAALLSAHHWQSALVVSDPPHIRRLDFCLQLVFKKSWLVLSVGTKYSVNLVC